MYVFVCVRNRDTQYCIASALISAAHCAVPNRPKDVQGCPAAPQEFSFDAFLALFLFAVPIVCLCVCVCVCSTSTDRQMSRAALQLLRGFLHPLFSCFRPRVCGSQRVCVGAPTRESSSHAPQTAIAWPLRRSRMDELIDRPAPASPDDDALAEVDDRVRFIQECEFVQMLANVEYLRHLAERDYFKQPAFVHYLEYLKYWKRPEYARLLMYPQCLYFLDQLQDPRFRGELQKPEFVNWLRGQQILHWKHHEEELVRMQVPQPTAPAAAPAPAVQPPGGPPAQPAAAPGAFPGAPGGGLPLPADGSAMAL